MLWAVSDLRLQRLQGNSFRQEITDKVKEYQIVLVSYNLRPKISKCFSNNLWNLFHCRFLLCLPNFYCSKKFSLVAVWVITGFVQNNQRTCWMFCTDKHCERLLCAVLFTVGVGLLIILAQIIKFIRSCLTVGYQSRETIGSTKIQKPRCFCLLSNYYVIPAKLLDLGYRGKMSEKCRWHIWQIVLEELFAKELVCPKINKQWGFLWQYRGIGFRER